ncbi:MAG: MFS transporter [Gemmatimonadaceae bacterium]|jgi:UMF1 family MFS transporter|nr:MFS transporter [Gemmatimonadaceae bacterium]
MSRPSFLTRLGLATPQQRAWAMYDWALSAAQTTLMTAVFPIYFVKVAGADLPPAKATQALATASTLYLIVTAVLSPILGAVADVTATRKRQLLACTVLGVAASAGMFLIERGDLTLAFWLFVAAMIGAVGATVFYESLLPHVARGDEVDRVSTAGYAMGYVGGGVLLALQLAWIQRPTLFGLPEDSTLPARLAFVSVAVWWAVFSVPILRGVPEPPRRRESDEHAGQSVWRTTVTRLGETLRSLRQYRQAGLMLLAFLIYNDGIQTIIKMATAYGTELGIGQGSLIAAILVVQFVGIPCAFAFGWLAGRIGTRPAIYLGLAVYTLASVLGYWMQDAGDFLRLAVLVGLVQGGTQALSRSLFASMVPAHKSGEFFGFYSVFEKFAGIFGPLLFAVAIEATGSSRNSILSVIAFFVVGGVLLAFVDPAAGRAEAQAAEQGLAPNG